MGNEHSKRGGGFDQAAGPEQRHGLPAAKPASPGIRPLIKSQPAPVQRKSLISRIPPREVPEGPIENWTNAVFRPDLYEPPVLRKSVNDGDRPDAEQGVPREVRGDLIAAPLSGSDAAIIQAKPDGQSPLAGGAAPSGVPTKNNAAGEQPTAESGLPELDAYKGATIGKVGKISAPAGQYEHAKTQGVNLRQRPHGRLPPIAAIRYGREAQVVAADNTDAFYFIVATAEGSAGLSGWINRQFVALDPPDPKAELHHIIEPNLTTILKHRYIDTGLWQLRTGNDYTTLAAATIAANQGRAGVDINWSQYEAYKRENPVKRWLDPWMIENFAIYHASKVIAGTNIWLPSPSYVRALQGTGVIGSRPDWANAAVDAGNGLAGFFTGVSAGAFGTLWDTLAGLWELGASMVSAVRGVFDGSLLSSISDLYDAVTHLSLDTAAKMVEDIITMGKDAFGDFKEAWGHPDTYKKWYFRGKAIGAVALEVVLAIFTGGAALGAKVIAKIGQYLPRLARVLGKLMSVADKLDISGKRKHHGDGHDGNRGRNQDRKEEVSEELREWEQARLLASLIAEEHDLANKPVTELIAVLKSTVASKFRAVRDYRAIPKAQPGHFQIIQLSRKKNRVDDDYSEKPTRETAPVGSGTELTHGGRKKIGGLYDLKDMRADEAIKLRGGGGSQINHIGELRHLTVGEIANLAAQGNLKAITAIKIIKDAKRLKEKY